MKPNRDERLIVIRLANATLQEAEQIIEHASAFGDGATGSIIDDSRRVEILSRSGLI
jgi:hypothetical protein